MPADRAIEVRDLVKTYPGDVRALAGISFAVPAGTVFGLLGPNGAGKSTTVKILTTLTRADSGTATVAGIDVGRQPNRVRRAIGCVFQKAAVDLEATGRENLVLQGRLYGLHGGGLRARADELLGRFGLAEAADRITRTYSGGMQRKLDVAMGLVHRPRVLFLDEPTTGLDPEARAEMWTEINRLSTAEGLTVLLTTHYLDEADRLADRLAIVDRGGIVAEGTPEELKSELRGDAIVVELAADLAATAPATATAAGGGAGAAAGGGAGGAAGGAALERVRGTLAGLNGSLRELTLDGRTLRARVDSGASAVPAVLAALDAGGIPVASATVARPSLDDVYLRYAGRAFSAANAEEPR
ncbi:MAG TPA: ATP-binding cassette domain-containing protein [Mycobacteriales bacterium]|nr:ATP-binding cassette domain-containing protein [Mycobacteriales bacterium]